MYNDQIFKTIVHSLLSMSTILFWQMNRLSSVNNSASMTQQIVSQITPTGMRCQDISKKQRAAATKYDTEYECHWLTRLNCPR